MDTIALYVQNWCNANPLKKAFLAGDALFESLPFYEK